MAQFNTVTIDGRIASGEYGSHVDGENQRVNGSIIWYMTWNSDSLYIAIAGADSAEGAILYIDIDADQPVNINQASSGNIDGKVYDNVTYHPPFRADFVCYFKDSYQEFRRADGAGGWTNSVLNGFNVKTKPHSGTSDTIEIAIPWDSITNGGGRPSKFNWFGHKTTNGTTFSYAPMPTENPSGNGATQSALRYFTVSSTNNGSSTFPFAQNSYTTPQASSGTLNFDDIDVYDFTINDYAGITIVKNNNKIFNIENDLVITSGELNLGNSDVSYSDSVKNDIVISSSGELALSSSTSNLYIGGDFVNNGSFTNNGSIVFLNGNVKKQTLTGNFNGSNRFSQLELNNNNGAIFSGADSLVVDDTLRLTNGVFEIGTGTRLRMNESATFLPDGGAKNSFVDGTLEWEMESSDKKVFPLGDDGEWARFEIEPENTKTGRSYVARYIKSGYGAYTIDMNSPTIDHVSILEYWEVEVEGTSLVTADSSAKLGGHWRPYSAASSMSMVRDSLRICHYNSGNNWELISGTQVVTDNGDSGVVTTDFTSKFSPFTLGTLAGRNLLPVTFTQLQLDNGKIIWSTLTEINNSHFNIYRKTDEQLQLIGSVEGHGNSNQIIEYQFNIGDRGDGCFLIEQVDFDGKVHKMGVVCANRLTGHEVGFANPINGARLVPLMNISNPNIQVFGSTGKMIFEGDYTQFDAQGILSGLYLIIYSNGNRFVTQRILK